MPPHDKPKHVLVTGSHRSGSTYVGEVLEKSPNYFVIHEPFNEGSGIKGVEHPFPYAPVGKTSNYGALADRFMAGKYKYRPYTSGLENVPITQKLKRYALHHTVGGTLQLKSTYYKHVAHRNKAMIIKDPMACLMSDYLSTRHDVQVVALIRHPAAFYNSVKRMGWAADLAAEFSQSAVVADLAPDAEDLLELAAKSRVHQVGVTWLFLYRSLHQFYEKHGADWKVVRHEDLCRQPFEVFEDIFRYLNVEMTETIRAYIRETNQSDSSEARGGATHDFFRDGQALADSWKSKVSSEETKILRDITQSVAEHYYSDRDWEI